MSLSCFITTFAKNSNMKALSSINDLQSPCYIFHEERFEDSVKELNEALSACFKHGNVAVSVKTNSSCVYLSKAASMGCMAEVVSEYEYRLALDCGFKPDMIVYNGPFKSEESFVHALKHGSTVNIETMRELDWLKKIPVTNQSFNIGIRININIEDIDKDESLICNADSRFGFFHKTGEIKKVINQISKIPHINIKGMSIHRTTKSRKPETYHNMAVYLSKLVKEYDLDIDYIDFGGGYSGMLPDSPTWIEYVMAIREGFNKSGLKIDRIIMEPGSALAGSSFDFLTECIDVHVSSHEKRICTINGSRNDIDPFFRKENYFYEIITRADSNRFPHQIIGGFTCLEDDIILRLVDEPTIEIGDKVLFKRTGAYTMTLTPSFIRPAVCSIYTHKNGTYVLSTKPGTELHEK